MFRLKRRNVSSLKYIDTSLARNQGCDRNL